MMENLQKLLEIGLGKKIDAGDLFSPPVGLLGARPSQQPSVNNVPASESQQPSPNNVTVSELPLPNPTMGQTTPVIVVGDNERRVAQGSTQNNQVKRLRGKEKGRVALIAHRRLFLIAPKNQLPLTGSISPYQLCSKRP
ncbi:hypothetical protein V6N11_021581 [Hibiscus sabdariffa]|uniref:Uncharacterized protein n=1 Tax=Hibiscus sabdariffa TaxID=183260 RepID=A0ABR2A017_9ROSI